MKNRVPPTRRPQSPAEELLVSGRMSPLAKLVVSFVENDEDGNLRLVEYVAERPIRRAA